MMFDLFKISVTNLKHRQLRSWLTVLGIIVGIAAIVSLISIGQGLENAIEFQFNKMGTGAIFVYPSGSLMSFGGVGLEKEAVNKIGNTKGVDYAYAMIMDYENIEYNDEVFYFSITSYDTSLGDAIFSDMDMKLDKGRFFKKSDENDIILGYKIAHDLFKKDVDTRSKIMVGENEFKVIGILENLGNEMDNRIFIPQKTMEEIFGEKDTVNMIRAKSNTGLDVEEVAKNIEKTLLKDYKKEDFEVITSAQLLSQVGVILLMVQFILGGIAAISLVVGGIGIMNSMFTSVLERTREIGIMKSIGATRKDILSIFIIESGFIGFIGGVIGVISGISFAKLVEIIAAQFGFPFLLIKINLSLVLFSLLFAFLVGIISGIIPAIMASKLTPVEALRYE